MIFGRRFFMTETTPATILLPAAILGSTGFILTIFVSMEIAETAGLQPKRFFAARTGTRQALLVGLLHLARLIAEAHCLMLPIRAQPKRCSLIVDEITITFSMRERARRGELLPMAAPAPAFLFIAAEISAELI